jgi:hypothetical protein
LKKWTGFFCLKIGNVADSGEDSNEALSSIKDVYGSSVLQEGLGCLKADVRLKSYDKRTKELKENSYER